MHAEIRTLAQRHNLAPQVVVDIEALLVRVLRASVLSTLDEPPTDVTLEPPSDAPTVERPGSSARYDDLGLLGMGAMGEVRRVRDRDLGRTVAMKTIRGELMKHATVVSRFVEEAQVAAQLQHPGVAPVHELGRLADGRLYFTMKEQRGRTFTEVIREVHDGPVETFAPGLRRLVGMFRSVCEAVGFAHARGVVHRDLKPANVMVGGFGEVLVVDWGLAKVRGRATVADEEVVTDRSRDDAQHTRMGMVAGTPAYMPPEQARGEVDRIDARSDVYALGAVLYEVLSGRPPYEGRDARAVLRQVLAGPPEAPGATVGAGSTFTFGLVPAVAASSGPPLPEELVATCLRAMEREPGDRFADGAALGAEVGAWLDGARRREQALGVLARAEALGPEAEGLLVRAAALREEAVTLLAEVKAWEPEEAKAPGWALEDDARALEDRVKLLRIEAEQTEQGALRVDPMLPEAHAALASRYLRLHGERERERNVGGAARSESHLRRHVEALPTEHAVRRESAAYLVGVGALTLVTDPPGAEVSLHRYGVRNRRLVPVFERSLGATPLLSVPLAMGSYLCVLRHPGRAEVRYPVSIGRGEHWDGVAPGERGAFPVALPRREDLDTDDVYVPAGWFVSGGDPEAADSLPRCRLWCEGLVMKRYPVTNREYLSFLDDLVARGREERRSAGCPGSGRRWRGRRARCATRAGRRVASRWSPTPRATPGMRTGRCSTCTSGARWRTGGGWPCGQANRGAFRENWSGRRRRVTVQPRLAGGAALSDGRA